MLNTRFFVLVGIILAAAAFRLIPHPANVTPIAAMALFGGAYFTSRMTALAVPLAAMALSDLVLALLGTDVVLLMPYVYGSFVATTCLAPWLVRPRRSPVRI